MIVDSSTLILLAKTGILDLFIEDRKLNITKKVKDEVIAEKKTIDSKLIEQRIKENKISITEIKDDSFYNKLIKEFNLGKGEAESIVFALEEKTILLTDDKKAINICKIFNIKFTTAMNILVKLYQEKKIDKIRAEAIFKKLKKFGRYSNEIIEKVEEDLKWKKCNLLWP